MQFRIYLRGELEVEKVINAESWEEASEKAKSLRVVDVLPTPKDFAYTDWGDTELKGIYKD